MIKAVIFDLNGVLIQSPKLSDRFQEEFGIPPEEFLAVLKEIMAKVRLPKNGDSFKYWKPYLEKWDINLTRERFFDFWFRDEKEVPETVELAKMKSFLFEGADKTRGILTNLLTVKF